MSGATSAAVQLVAGVVIGVLLFFAMYGLGLLP